MNYQLSNEVVTVTISSLGAELCSICKDGQEYLWNGDAAYWAERAPILFPFVGRLTEGKYSFKGSAYEMDIHGFARKMEYKVAAQSENSISFELSDNAETYASYPFHFLLGITYTLEAAVIRMKFHVKNQSDEMMYFGIGGHPGFSVPLEPGLDFSDYYLEFGQKHRPEQVGLTDTCFLNGINTEFLLEGGQRLSLRHEMFDNDAIVLQNIADEVTLKSDKGNRSVTVTYPRLPFLGLWHAPKTTAPYICIEPWTSLPSRQGIVEDLQFKDDLIRLCGGGVYENVWEIKVK